MYKRYYGGWMAAATLLVVAWPLKAQERPMPPQSAAEDVVSLRPERKSRTVVPFKQEPRFSLERQVLKSLPSDQFAVWSGPFRTRPKDLFIVLPFIAVGGALIATDRDTSPELQRRLTLRRTRHFADIGVVAAGGISAAMYAWSFAENDAKARETAVLSAAAMGQSFATGELLKLIARRERPEKGAGEGKFFHGGDSFPSNHSMMAWSFASVVAHEYPGKLTKAGVYGLASAVSISRVARGKHFASDAYLGGLLGWWIGREVYRRHHAEDLGGADIGTFLPSLEEADAPRRKNVATVTVPIEHWGYAAVDRLQALGIVQSAFLGMRPWNRAEFVRLVLEAEDRVRDVDPEERSEGARLLQVLRDEFNAEQEYAGAGCCRRARLESVYMRVGGTSDAPLNDGYHFSQTIENDYGRPFALGVHGIAGASGSLRYDHWLLYVRAEYQHAPSAPALPLSARQAIVGADFTPLEPAIPFPTINRVRLLDAYLAFQNRGWQISIGKQTLWWGPFDSSAFMFANNAEPIPMLRVARTEPATLPGFLGRLGPWRAEVFIGQLGGHRYEKTSTQLFTPPLPRQPLIHGGKLSLRPTPNLEFGVSASTIFAGPGSPLTFRTLFRSFSLSNATPGDPTDPGDRRAGFDFSYRLPFLRHWVTIYNDSFTEDEFSPIAYPRRSAMHPGIYLPKLPFLPRADFRAEGFYTDLPGLAASGQYYFNTRYLSGYTNEGNVLGGPGGRQGLGWRAATTYWLNPDKKLQAGYRTLSVSKDFVPGGGRQHNIFGKVDWKLARTVAVDVMVQYEYWRFAALSPAPSRNMTTMFQFTYRPRTQ